MSKVTELAKKYSNVSSATFNKFVEGDTTPSKKYLEYYLKIWTDKSNQKSFPTSTSKFISTVQSFDKLTPYIENKDIYSSEYLSYVRLSEAVEKAEKTKLEKTFDRNKHIKVLSETEDYILLSPITFLGSLKYGYGTKWCTASKEQPSFFRKYYKTGLLVYLIDKKNKKKENYNKVAFFCPFTDSEFNSEIEIYNSFDKRVRESSLYKSGWNQEEFFEFFTIFRYTFYKQKIIRNTIKKLDNFLKIIDKIDSNKIDFDQMKENCCKLEMLGVKHYNFDIQDKIEKFENKIKNLYATT